MSHQTNLFDWRGKYTFPATSEADAGAEYDPSLDRARLSGQLRAVAELMADGRWRTLQEIADATGAPHASVSAQLRHLRKPRHGAHTVQKRRRGDGGTWEYRVEKSGDRSRRSRSPAA